MNDPNQAETPAARDFAPADAPTTPRPTRSLIPLAIAGGVVLVALAGGLLVLRADSRVNKVALASAPKPVTTIPAKSAAYRPTRVYIGTLRPWVEASVGPQLVSAYVDTVLVRPGAVVKRGDVLATLDCRNVSAESAAISSTARAIEARQRAMANESARIQGLLDGGFVSPNEAEQKQAQSVSEQAQLDSQRAQLTRSSLEVNDCILRAPFDGEIGRRLADPGAFAKPGMAIVTIVDRATVRMTGDAPENDFEVVAPMTKTQVHLLATGGDVSAVISRRAPSADPGTRTVRFEIDIPDSDRKIPVDTTGEVRIEVGEPQPSSEIPISAASTNGEKATVYVVEDGIAHARPLKVRGERAGSLFFDTKELAPGASVVTEGRALLNDGDRVETATKGGGKMTGLALRNPIAVLMLCIALMVFSAVTTPRMSVDTFPELTPPVLVIGTLAPGLGPRDVEKTLSWRIEKYVSSTPGVDHVQSVSRNGMSIIYVWLKWGTDLNASQTLVQQQVSFAMAAVPKSLGVLPPFVLQYDPSNAPVVQVVVKGKGYTGPQLYDYALNNVEPLLEGISGVASAAPDGGRMRQINVVVDPVRAQARNVTANDVAEAVAKSNALLPSGEFIAKTFDANVYTNAVPARVATIGDAPLRVVNGVPVFIRDVARVEDSGTPATQSVSVNGEEAVYLNVLRIPGGNTLQIVDAVKKVTSELKLPPGVEVKAVFDQSTFVRTTYHGLKKEIVQALVLIALVILLFLQSVRGTLIVSVAIPLSFAITLLVLYVAGQTLNAFTLGGLTLAMGRLVDDAVVVLESIHRHQRMGMSPRRAALEGTNAVALPVLASTLTTMAVLLPVLLLAGLAKKLFAPLALTVAVAMIASYFVSMAVTPVACRYFLGHAEHGRFGKWVEGRIDRVAEAYASLLRRALPFRFTIILASLALVVGSGWAAARLPSTFFPEIDESMDQIYVRFAPGTSLEDAAAQLKAMGKALKDELPPGSVDLVIENVGTPQNARAAIVSPNVAPNTGYLRLQFTDPEERSLSQSELAVRARQILQTRFPGTETLQYPGGLVASVFANGYTAPIAIELRGESLLELDEQARAVAEVARTVPGVRDVRQAVQLQYPEIRVDTDRDKAGLVGVDARMAAQTTLNATLGNINTPSVWIDPRNGQSYYVVTSYDPARVSETRELAQLPVRVDDEGRPVLLGAYGNIRRTMGPIAVERNHLERAVHVYMQTEGRDIGTVASDLDKVLAKDPRTRDIRYEFVGQVQLMRDTFSGLGLALGLAVMVVFMIMASQFKSLRLPFVMLFTIPVSLVGIVLALMAAGQGFSITALMGVLMVIGIAVSNGILLVDDATRRLGEGVSKLESIALAARSRFVPIAMTSIATVIGLIPTAAGLEHGSEANQPLALAVVGGLTSSTFLSLFLVPVMFLFFAKEGAPATDDDEGHVQADGAHA